MTDFHRPLLALAVLASFALASWCGAQLLPGSPLPGQKKDPTGNDLVSVRVLADGASLKAGATVHVGVLFTVEPHWHIYWKNPGEGGVSTVLDIKAPGGWTVGEVQWPRPSVFKSEYETSYGYEKAAMLVVPLTAPADWSGDSVDLEVSASWLVCRNVCMKGQARQAARLKAGAALAAADQKLFEQHRARLTRPLKAMERAVLSFDGERLRIAGPASGKTEIGFIPDDCPGVEFGEPAVHINGDEFVIEMEIELSPQNALGKPMRLAGVVTCGSSPDEPSFWFDVPAATTRPNESPASVVESAG